MDETLWGRGEKILANDDGTLIFCHYCPCTYVIVYVCTIMEITDNRDPDHPVTGRVVMPLAGTDNWPEPDAMGFYGLQVVPYDELHGKVQLGGQWWELGTEYNELYESGLANCRGGWKCVAGKIGVVARCADNETPRQFCSAAKAQQFINSHTSLYWFCRISKHACNCCYAMGGGWIGGAADGVMYNFEIVQTVHYTESTKILRVGDVLNSLNLDEDPSYSNYDKSTTYSDITGQVTLSGKGRAYRYNVYSPYGTGLAIDTDTASDLVKDSRYLNTGVTPYEYTNDSSSSYNGQTSTYHQHTTQIFKTLNHSQNFHPSKLVMSALCFDDSDTGESLKVGSDNLNNSNNHYTVWWGDFYSYGATVGFDTGVLQVDSYTSGSNQPGKSSSFDTMEFGDIGVSYSSDESSPWGALKYQQNPSHTSYGANQWEYDDSGYGSKYWSYGDITGQYSETYTTRPELDIYMITGTQVRRREWLLTNIQFESMGYYDPDPTHGGTSGDTSKSETRYHLIVEDTIVLTAADPCDNTDADPQIQSVFASLPEDLRQSRVYEKSSQESK